MKDIPALERLADTLRRAPESTRTILVTLVEGGVAALTAVAFLLATNKLFALTFIAYARRSPGFFLVASFLTIMLSSLAVGLLLQLLCPEAAGSGIPQLKVAYWKELGYVPLRPVLVKFLAGVISLGGGASLGREGPTVFMGGGIASYLSGYLGSAKRERRGPAVVGASAGLAAAFNTPLAAITFVLEEIVGDISSRSIGKVVLSSVIGAFVVFAFVGRQPAFSLPAIDQVSWLHYLVVPLVALAAALIGLFFQRSALALRARVRGQRLLPPWAMPCVGGFITWVIGAGAFLWTGKLGVFGLGYQDLSSVLHNEFVWWIAGILVVGKLAATIASYSFGGCGGIFSPLLFLGGLCGYFIGGLVGFVLPLSPADRVVLSAVGMSACLGTVVRAPLSAMLIVFEMTHQFSLVPALLLGMFISMLASRLAFPVNFYDALLVQDGHELHKIRPPQDLHGWQSLPIGAIATPRPVMVRSLLEEDLRRLVSSHPYACYPLVLDGALRGILRRDVILAALAHHTVPEAEPATVCSPDQSVREVAERFLESPSGVIVLERDGLVSGIITLHDLLRAQAAILD